VNAHVNLLPIAIQKARRLRRRRRFWIGLCVLVAAIQAGSVLIANERAREVRFRKQQTAQARASLVQKRKERDDTRAKAQELTREISAAERLREKHLWSRWFGSLSLMMSPRIVLTEMRTDPAGPVDVAGLVQHEIRPAAAENPAADSLRRLPEVREVRDLFARQNLKAGRSGSPDDSAKDGIDSDPVADFLHTHELQATFQDGREVVALINRQVIRTGQAVDGFELVKVEPFRAIFRQQDLQAVLDLRLHPPGPKTQSGSVSPGTSPANP